MASFSDGKAEVCEWIRNNFPKGSTCLDVGACDGIWYDLLGDYLQMDACEIFEPNIQHNQLRDKYNFVFSGDIYDYWYGRNKYDLIIFGDVIEHMSVVKAQQVLEYARSRCKDMIVSVPYLYPQGELYGNKYERHIQSELTEEIFRIRYKNFKILFKPNDHYCYWHSPQSTGI